jgi:5-oxoprolinase (ATP-hydrolysing) subunit A
MKAIDLNADLGEGFPNDIQLLELVTSASIACGAHAGSFETARATLLEARVRGVRVGAHPGYADREGFGRRPQSVSQNEVRALIEHQVQDLVERIGNSEIPVEFVKPHGALYNQAQKEDAVARGVIDAVKMLGLPVLGLPGSLLERLAVEVDVRFVTEGFPERRYEPDGRLVDRSRADAVIHDPVEVAEQVLRLVDRGVQTLCIHGDDPHAVAKAETVRAALERRGIQVKPWT